MRVNLTISFDPAFVARMDGQRAGVSRGAWLEALAPGNGGGEGPESQVPGVDIVSDERVPDGVAVQIERPVRVKPTPDRPIIQKGGEK